MFRPTQTLCATTSLTILSGLFLNLALLALVTDTGQPEPGSPGFPGDRNDCAFWGVERLTEALIGQTVLLAIVFTAVLGLTVVQVLTDEVWQRATLSRFIAPTPEEQCYQAAGISVLILSAITIFSIWVWGATVFITLSHNDCIWVMAQNGHAVLATVFTVIAAFSLGFMVAAPIVASVSVCMIAVWQQGGSSCDGDRDIEMVVA